MSLIAEMSNHQLHPSRDKVAKLAAATRIEPDPSLMATAAIVPARVSRRASLARCTLGLFAAWALAGCATSPDEAPFPSVPEPEPEPRLSSEDEMARLQQGANPIVAGETLDGPLLRRFYARRDFAPVWADRRAQAEALTETVLSAGDHGMDPELFHAALLRRMSMFPTIRQELLLTHAVLTYAQALASGAVPVRRRKEGQDLVPEPVDVAAVLDAALDSPDAAAVIEALAPRTPSYWMLRLALQRLRPGGVLDDAPPERLRLIEANLERQRWLPRRLPADRVWVNVADQKLVLYRDDRPVFTTNVVVGDIEERKQSPEFRTVIEGAFLNPPWIIPRDIVAADILPRLAQDPGFLTRSNIVLLPNGEAEQAAGPQAGLGVILFDMPNRFDVFLHDTPDRTVFGRQNRRISNGCIRVLNPLEFAALLMDQPLATIQRKIATEGSVRKPLTDPVPVFIVYQTAFASSAGVLETRPDFYDRDAALWQRLYRHVPERRARIRQQAEATTGAARYARGANRPTQPSSPGPEATGRR